MSVRSATPPSPTALSLAEEDAREVLAARALEEADRDGAELPLRARRAATDAALEDVGDGEPVRFLVARARRLLAGREPLLPRLPAVPLPAFVLVALAVGLATNLLGGRRVQVLWNPVLGLVAWNLAVYVALLVRRPRARDGGRGPGLPALLAAQGPRAWRGLAARLGAGASSTARIEARSRFLAHWARATLALRLARARLLLHLGAGLVALGAVGGMYLRGLVIEYRVTWESTFLDEAGQRRVLEVLLAPALLVRGERLPDLAPLRAPADAPAAPWVHRYAWTVALLVLVPRGTLAALEARRARSLRARVPLDAADPYVRRLLAPARGEAELALVLPYARPLDGAAADRLAALLADHLGARATVRTLPALAYGAGVERVPASEDGVHRTLVVVFPLAQPPEAEVHGRFVAELAAARGSDDALLALVDDAGYRERLGPGAAGRLAERRAAWDRVLSAEGARPVHLDLGALDADAALERLAEASA